MKTGIITGYVKLTVNGREIPSSVKVCIVKHIGGL